MRDLTRSLVLVILLPLGVRSWAAQLPATSREAAELLRSGDFSSGCEQAHKAFEESPRSSAVLNLLGLCATQKGDPHGAENLFRKSISLNPRFIDPHINLAVNLVQRGQSDEALKQFQQVLTIDPDNVTALYNLGSIELASHSVRQAVTHLNRAATLAPADAQISLAFCGALFASGRDEQARVRISRMVQAQADPFVLLGAAVLAARIGDENLARQGINKALRIKPGIQAEVLRLARIACLQQDYKTSMALLSSIKDEAKENAEWNAISGYVRYKLGDAARAQAYLERAIEIDPGAEDSYMKMGELMLFHNSYKAAAAYFELGLKQLPASALLHFGLAVSCLAGNLNPEAIREHLERALQLSPDFTSALSALSMACQQDKDWEGLRNAADRLIKLNPNSHEGYFYKGLAIMNRDSGLNAARQLLEQSIRLNPGFADSRVALGELLVREEQLSSGIQQLERAIAIDPKSTRAYYHLATAYRRAGASEKAAKALDMFKQLKAKQPAQWEVLFQVRDRLNSR